VCGEATHGESKHTLSCSVVTHTAYIHTYIYTHIYIYICALAVLKSGKKERGQKRKMKRGNKKNGKKIKKAIYIQRLSNEAKTGLPQSNLR
jgi:hypothetical protein